MREGLIDSPNQEFTRKAIFRQGKTWARAELDGSELSMAYIKQLT
jgi:hypothetical protein